jgi:hypothetical protein
MDTERFCFVGRHQALLNARYSRGRCLPAGIEQRDLIE